MLPYLGTLLPVGNVHILRGRESHEVHDNTLKALVQIVSIWSSFTAWAYNLPTEEMAKSQLMI